MIDTTEPLYHTNEDHIVDSSGLKFHSLTALIIGFDAMFDLMF
jgi:hypothetical protein